MKATTEQIVSALRVLSVEMHSEDGVANAVVAEAADRLTLMANLVARHVEETKEDTEQMAVASETMVEATAKIQSLRERIKRLEEALSWRWRSIETAPHNHTWILGYDEKDGETGMIIFNRGDESEPHWTDGMREWSPTHWMPLPDEPKTKEAKL